MVFKITGITFSSDLRKPCWKTGKSVSLQSNKCPVLEKTQRYINGSDIPVVRSDDGVPNGLWSKVKESPNASVCAFNASFYQILMNYLLCKLVPQFTLHYRVLMDIIMLFFFLKGQISLLL